jgi:Rrf2 family transcriptional regulator, cysteine metabolism repressor
MKISTKGQYALESIVDMVVNTENNRDSLMNISRRRNISVKYLGQIFIKLKKAGIVKSTRGAGGGYSLVRSPEKITAWQVISALEGVMAPVNCITTEMESNYCHRFEGCITRRLWQKTLDAVNRAANSVTIADIAGCYNKMRADNGQEYMI